MSELSTSARWLAVSGLWVVGSVAAAGGFLALLLDSQRAQGEMVWLLLTTPVLIASFWLGSRQLMKLVPRMREAAYSYFGFALFVGFAICWSILEVVI
jgi:hypothetical protein